MRGDSATCTTAAGKNRAGLHNFSPAKNRIMDRQFDVTLPAEVVALTCPKKTKNPCPNGGGGDGLDRRVGGGQDNSPSPEDKENIDTNCCQDPSLKLCKSEQYGHFPRGPLKREDIKPPMWDSGNEACCLFYCKGFCLYGTNCSRSTLRSKPNEM